MPDLKLIDGVVKLLHLDFWKSLALTIIMGVVLFVPVEALSGLRTGWLLAMFIFLFVVGLVMTVITLFSSRAQGLGEGVSDRLKKHDAKQWFERMTDDAIRETLWEIFNAPAHSKQFSVPTPATSQLERHLMIYEELNGGLHYDGSTKKQYTVQPWVVDWLQRK